MRNLLGFMVILVLFSACRRKDYMYKNAEDQCCCVVEFADDERKSIYDSIAPAQLILDSTEFYVRLNNILEFTNKMDWDGGTFYIGQGGKIDSTGDLFFDRRSLHNYRNLEELTVLKQVFFLLSNWKPAYLLKDPDHKIPYEIDVSMGIYEDTISVRVRGDEQHFVVKKNFKRPIIPIRAPGDCEDENKDRQGRDFAFARRTMAINIVPPQLIIDSAKFYRKLQGFLKFTNNLEWHGLIKSADATFTVDSTGKFIPPMATEAANVLRPGIEEATNKIFQQTKHWKPAYLLGQPGYTVDYDVFIWIVVEEKRVRFRMFGEAGGYLLKKDFGRPL